tara:strand:- start:290 stop:1540 length:1251 start_codon:yes stop_codon:yes gene_type:complete
MPKTRTGLSYLAKPRTQTQKRKEIFPARVEFILLDNLTDPDIFTALGEWSAIGSIYFSSVNFASGPFNKNNIAKPLFPNLKNYPLKNEIVYIVTLPSDNIQQEVNDVKYYYFQSVNIWNSNHHNAIPNILNGADLPPTQQQDYDQARIGAVSRVDNETPGIDLGNTFVERNNIKPVQAFEGDIIHEGRWGQSLRFGSTVQNSTIFNSWSNTGLNGDPITILRNDQHIDDNDPWVPQVENINLDRSSIYLTSTQQIPIEVASKKYKSYETGLEPKLPNSYSDSQIILNSGRLLFNSYDDSILLSSNDSINLNALETVNVDAEEGFSVSVGNEGEILLGSSDFGVIEPVILGDKFLADIENLANILVNLGNNFELNPMLTTDETSNATLLNIGGELKESAQKILNNLENYKSKVTFSK